ncbi:LOW QUALITY PROTEIN: kinesin light chain 1 [Bipolaris maydis]|nr:LOW QUALITY PROTEIN: kinesin light chain 1 [Bipolaris maydis]
MAMLRVDSVVTSTEISDILCNAEFFSRDCKWLGNKISLEQEINRVTGIPAEAFRGHSLAEFSIEERMSWEDRVYCLLGIFGVFMALIYGEGEEYAALRLKEEIQKRQQASKKADLQDSSAVLSLPFPQNERFAGRESQLQSMKQTTHQRLTIYGLGGCGKSALALEFAYCARADQSRCLVFWVPAISQESFELAYRDIGNQLRIPGIDDANADIKQLVRDTLSSGNLGSWLMTIDNADDSEVLLGTIKSTRLIDYVPCRSVLFTTRSRKAATDLTPNNVLELNDTDRFKARQLFVHRINNQALLIDGTAVNALLEVLTGLPLAIIQAANFINQNEISVSKYTSLLQHASTKVKLFSEHFEDPNSTVAKTGKTLTAEYLSFVEYINHSLLPPGGSAVQQTKAIGTLTGYAFITERRQAVPGSSTERLFDMHRLGHGKREKWAGIAAVRAQELVPERWSVYLPHALYLAGLVGLVDDLRRASLLTRCQETLGLYRLAATTQQTALLLRKKLLCSEHLETLSTMSCLASALNGLGKYNEAEAIRREELAIRPDNGDTLATVGELSTVLYNQGNLNQAEALSQQTLHPQTLEIMNNFALRQRRHKETEILHTQGLAITEKLFGPEHPNTLISMENVALDQYTEAEAMYQQILDKILKHRENLLGPEHPDTIAIMYNLADSLYAQEEYDEAETIYQQTLERRVNLLGREHPDTLEAMDNMTTALYKQKKKYNETEIIRYRMVVLQEKLLGPEHPDVLQK